MKPIISYPVNPKEYVYAKCKCELPIEFAIRMKRIPGKTKYTFRCDDCGTEGIVYTTGAAPQI